MTMPEINHVSRKTKSPVINPTLIGGAFLGICILISGFNIGGGLKKLNNTLAETNFTSTNTFNTPSSMAMGEKKYMSEDEAAEYLNMTSEKVVSLISNGEIKEYVKTDSGYSISVKVLDEWFDNAAYQTRINAGANTQ